MAVAAHVEAGDLLAERVFSARHLGDSKALNRVRSQLERLLGPLASLGIREGAAITLAGGYGRLPVGDQDINLQRVLPFIGLARESWLALESIDFPPKGLVVVENLATFEACCRQEVSALKDTMIVWSSGYPGRNVRAVVEAAVSAQARIRIWADLDLDGIRIARLISTWAFGRAEPVYMSPDDVANAQITRPLGRRARLAVEADLSEHPKAFLSETLRAILQHDAWVEQETFLGNTTDDVHTANP